MTIHYFLTKKQAQTQCQIDFEISRSPLWTTDSKKIGHLHHSLLCTQHLATACLNCKHLCIGCLLLSFPNLAFNFLDNLFLGFLKINFEDLRIWCIHLLNFNRQFRVRRYHFMKYHTSMNFDTHYFFNFYLMN